FFAIVTLRLEIDFGPDAVVFVNRLDAHAPVWFGVPYEPAEADRKFGADREPYVAQVVEGVRAVLTSLSPDGAPIRAARIALVDMRVRVHPVDSRPRDFKQAAVRAVTQAIEAVGLGEGPV